MLSLSEASSDTRKFLKISAVILTILFILFIIIKITFIVKDILYPPQAPIADSAFGKLTQQIFPQNASNKTFNYSINTITGDLPTIQSLANVYRYETIKPDLLGVNKFQQKISVIGYPTTYTAVSGTTFEWNLDSQNLIKTLRANVITGNFSITSPFMQNPDVIASNNLPKVSKAINKASGLLYDMQLFSNDLDSTKTKTNLYSISNGTLIPATSISTAQIIEVNFYPKDIDKLPTIYENPNSSNIQVKIAGGNSYDGQIVGATYIHQNLTQIKSSYSLKTTAQAYKELQQGQAYIASYKGDSNNVSINNVYLAYYVSSQPQDFLMPVYVFTGNDNFYAYVPAIRDEWINK